MDLKQRWSLMVFLATMVFAACDTGSEADIKEENEKKKGDESVETDVEGEGDTDDPDAGDIDTSDDEENDPPYTKALVITTDYETGAYSTVALNDYSVDKEIDFIHSDALCYFDPVTNTPFIVQRLGADSVVMLDREAFTATKEFSVEEGSNPNGIVVVSDETAVVSRYGSDTMWVVSLSKGKKDGEIDLGKYSDDDGSPEVAGLTLYDGLIYAPIQQLDRNGDWQPIDDGKVIVIDAENEKIETVIELEGSNPYGPLVYAPAVEQFVVAETGGFSDLDGGVELIDPQTLEASGFVVTEETLGGNITSAVVVSEEKGYAIVGVSADLGSNTYVMSFNPKTGKKIDTLLKGDGWLYTMLALTPDGEELWVTDGTIDNPGIRVFDVENDEELTDAPIDVGLPPSQICFTR